MFQFIAYARCDVISYMDYTLKTNFICIKKSDAIHIDKLLSLKS